MTMSTSGWKNINVEYGKDFLSIKVPFWCDILSMRYIPSLENPKKQIENALSNPIGSLSIENIVASCKKPSSRVRVAITVSDNTRPVPYNGEKEDGILLPLLKRLKKAEVKNRNIKIIVGTGTHLPTSNEWKKEAFGKSITDAYAIIDHRCTSSDLCYLANIDGAAVKINRQFLEADVHIATGLVEPHFMAGVSGGRKAICPGLVNLDTTHVFHGVEFMNNPNATNLMLKDNPCHNFALKVARKARVDFSVNVVLNSKMKLAGVFAGDLEKAHLRAVKRVKDYCVIPIDRQYDIVLTQGGRVAINHYQTAKAAYGTIPIIKKGGIVILVAHNSDKESVGKSDYKEVMKILKEKGPGRFTEFITRDSWQFVPDQWEVQKWDQFFRKIGIFDGLIYCTTNINPECLKELPGKSGYDFVEEEEVGIERIVQNAVFYAVEKIKQKTRKPKMAFIKEGPYAVPVIK